MNKKQIIIDAPDGQVIDIEHFHQTGNVRFINEQPAKIKFPKKWSLQTKEYYYISSNSAIGWFNLGNSTSSNSFKNSIPTETLAEQMLIFIQLITMRECYRKIEKLNNPELGEIDWNHSKAKHFVCLENNRLKNLTCYDVSQTFSFQLADTRDEFAKNFGDMILQCKDILG